MPPPRMGFDQPVPTAPRTRMPGVSQSVRSDAIERRTQVSSCAATSGCPAGRRPPAPPREARRGPASPCRWPRVFSAGAAGRPSACAAGSRSVRCRAPHRGPLEPRKRSPRHPADGRRAGAGGGFARADRAHTRASSRPLQRFSGNRITDDPRILGASRHATTWSRRYELSPSRDLYLGPTSHATILHPDPGLDPRSCQRPRPATPPGRMAVARPPAGTPRSRPRPRARAGRRMPLCLGRPAPVWERSWPSAVHPGSGCDLPGEVGRVVADPAEQRRAPGVLPAPAEGVEPRRGSDSA